MPQSACSVLQLLKKPSKATEREINFPFGFLLALIVSLKIDDRLFFGILFSDKRRNF